MQHQNDNVFNVLTQVKKAIDSCSKGSQKRMKQIVFSSINRFEKQFDKKLSEMNARQIEIIEDDLLVEIN